jgi:hypothetical protein
MNLNPAKCNKFLNGVGQLFVWQKAYACPCVSSESGQPKINCAHCGGLGRIWGEGVEGVAGVVGRDVAKRQLGFGVFSETDTMLSIPSDSALYEVGMYDRVTAVNKTEPFSQNLVYGIHTKLKFTPTEINQVMWIGENGELIEGDIPKVNVDNTLIWTGLTPPLKTTYSMTGRRNADYYCYISLPLDRPEHKGAKLPRRVVLRTFDLFNQQ